MGVAKVHEGRRGGEQFRDKFKAWADEHNIVLDSSSPYNSQLNGLAKAAIKNVKRLIRKCSETGQNLQQAMLEFRNCPSLGKGLARANGFSPAQAFLGRRQRGQLPFVQDKRFFLFDQEKYDQVRKEESLAIEQHDQGKALEILQPGQSVCIQDPINGKWERTGQIIKLFNEFERSYEIESNGKSLRRDR